MKKRLIFAAAALMLAFVVVGVSLSGYVQDAVVDVAAAADESDQTGTVAAETLISTDGSALDTTELFTSRDLEQTADLEEATYLTLTDGEDLLISEEGVCVLSEDAQNVTVTVDADGEAKVQLVLDGVTIVNEDAPAISVLSADKVFITLSGENDLEVTGDYETKSLDSVIISKDDLTLNGTGSLTVVSKKGNGITS